MVRTFCISVMLSILFASNTLAGFYSSVQNRESGIIVAAVEIKDKGIHNLVISIQFLRKPHDKKLYKSDEFEELIDRLQVEWRGIALQKVLESKELKVSDLSELKNNIETEIKQLVDRMKKIMVPEKDIEVVFSLSDFFLLEPKDD